MKKYIIIDENGKLVGEWMNKAQRDEILKRIEPIPNDPIFFAEERAEIIKSCYKCTSQDNCSKYSAALACLTPLTSASGLERKKAEDFIAEQMNCAERTATACASYVDVTDKEVSR